MNVVFLSPSFPPTAPQFCAALRARGVQVLGIGDAVLPVGSVEEAALTDYAFEPQMERYDVLSRAVDRLRERHGRIDRIDSNGEHWLEAEARLRDDFDVPGLRHAQVERQRSKLGMAAIFARAGIAHPPGVRVDSAETLRRFAAEHGFPLVLKPDKGSGAADTFSVVDQAELERIVDKPLQGHVVQPFVNGNIVTYDGLADRDGNVVFCTSHVYDMGIMQLRQGRLDGHYYSLRELPSALEQVGRRAVTAFGVRERFFHAEFFAHDDGSHTALEMNLRPPGGFTTDMLNAACDIDIYALWADVLTGQPLGNFVYQRKYYTAHVGRRDEHTYASSPDALIAALGSTLVVQRRIPDAFSVTMGNTMYLLRHPELAALRAAIALVQAR